jgi:predicted nucleotidyltransferase
MGLLRHPLDSVLGSVTKVRLLRALLPLERPVSLREAARLAGVSPAAASGALDELAALQVVDRREATSQHLYTVNRKNRLADALAGLFAAEEERREMLMGSLRRDVEGGQPGPSVEAAALFGSAARGDDRPDSDLDLLVIAEGEGDEEAIWAHLVEVRARYEREFGVKLSPVVMTLERLRERARSGDPLIANVVEDGIKLTGPPIQKLIRG